MSIRTIAMHIISKCIYFHLCKIEGNAVALQCNFEGKNKIGPNTYVKECDMRYGSYVGKNSTLAGAKIGRFCSIVAG